MQRVNITGVLVVAVINNLLVNDSIIMTMHTKTQLAPAIVFSLAAVHLALLLSDTEFEGAFRTLITATFTLNLLGYATFGYLLNPVWYKWVGQERGGLSIKQVRKCESSRMVTNFVTDIAGNLGILAFLGSTYSLPSYTQAIRTAGLLYLGSVLPNVHHYFWEDRSLKLVYTVETYQFVRRVVAACALVFYSQAWNEVLPGTVDAYPSNTLVIPIIPCLIMSVLRFGLGFLWYGPLMGTRVWLPSIREFKRDKKFPDQAEAEKEMPWLLAGGFVCGAIQNALLLPLQAQMGATSLSGALKLGYTLFFFFVLPSVSSDMWEGKKGVCVLNH